MKISKLNQFNQTGRISAGFTLIELLVSISIMGIVFALVGNGITFMVSSDQKLAAAQSRRVEVSHALDVISYDIRKAENVNGTRNSSPVTNVAAAIAASVANTNPTDGEGSLGASWNTSSTPTEERFIPVLFLKISIVCSDNKIVNERVIYSTKAKVAGDGRVGPNVLYRYGRIADENDSIPCSFDTATNTVVVAAPVNVPISDNIIAATTPPTCESPTLTPPAPAATSEGANGFYTCVSDNQVSIALFAKLTNSLIYGDNRTITSGSISSTATVTGGSVTTAIVTDDCEVPDLLTTPTTPSAANDSISTAPTIPTVINPTVSNKGLSYTGIAINGGTKVVSQTPSAGSKIPCKTGLVTYTY